mgnify:CR=1 FL=1
MINPTNKEFADAVFHTLPTGAHIYGTAFKEAPDQAGNGVWFGGAIKDRSLVRRSNFTNGECNTFYVVSSFYPDAEGRVYRRKAQFAAAHVITLDDIGDGMSAKIPWDKVALPGSFVIETSPDNCQVGYILDKPETDADLFNRVVDALIEQGLASPTDPGMKGVTRYVRFPVGTNNKTKYDPPHQHVCREWNLERRYSLQNIIDAYGLTLAPPTPERMFDRVAVHHTDDPYLKCLSDLGLVLSAKPRSGGQFEMVDILCPFHEDHTDRIEVGTVYVIGGGFKCMHGHCIDRTFRDVKERLHLKYGVDTAAIDAETAAAHEQVMTKGTLALVEYLNRKG